MDLTPTGTKTNESTHQVTIADLIEFCRGSWKPVVTGAVVLGGIALLVLLFVLPDTYESSAVLVVVQPTFSSELEPATLSVQGYQRLLESDAVIAATMRRLKAENLLEPSQSLRLGDDIRSRIFVSRRSEERELAPMIEAVAQWPQAEAAAEIANTWATVFLEHVQQLMGGTTSSTVRFVDDQYGRAKTDLTELEEQKLELDVAFFDDHDATSQSWDEKILRYESSSEDLIAAYASETVSLVGNLKASLNLDTRTAQLKALRRAYEELQDEQARVESQLALNQLRLEAADQQLTSTPETLTLRRGITDEAVWEALAAGSGDRSSPDLDTVFDNRLVAEELNPVYLDLRTRALALELEVRALEPRADQLRARLEKITEEIHALDTELSNDLANLEDLRQRRAAGAKNLQRERQLGLDHLMQDKERALDLLQQRWETTGVQIDRQISQQSDLFSDLAITFNEASLARANPVVEDVRIGALAVPAERPVSAHVILQSAVAALIGAFLGVAFALVRQSREIQTRG